MNDRKPLEYKVFVEFIYQYNHYKKYSAHLHIKKRQGQPVAYRLPLALCVRRRRGYVSVEAYVDLHAVRDALVDAVTFQHAGSAAAVAYAESGAVDGENGGVAL